MNIKLIMLGNILFFILIGWGLVELFLYLQEYGLKNLIDSLWLGSGN